MAAAAESIPLPDTYRKNNFFAKRTEKNVLYMQKHDDTCGSPMRCSLEHRARVTWCPFATTALVQCPGCRETLRFPHCHEMLPHLLRQDMCSCSTIGRAVPMRYIDLAEKEKLSAGPDYWHILHVDMSRGQVIPVWVSREGRIGVGCYAKLDDVEQCIIIVRGRWSVKNVSKKGAEVRPPVLYHPFYIISNVLGLEDPKNPQYKIDCAKTYKLAIDWKTSTSERLDQIFTYFATSMRSIVWNGLPTTPAFVVGPAPISPVQPKTTTESSPALLAKDFDITLLPESECI